MRLPSSLMILALILCVSLVGAQDAAGSGSSGIEVAEHEQFGTYLTDSEGRSLYLFTNDEQGGASTCYEECAENWPPVIVEEAPVAGERVAQSLIGTVERDDGSLQATYYGWPLYYFARDEEPGDTQGHGVGDVWFLVSRYGQAVEAPAQEQEDGAEEEETDTDEQETEGQQRGGGHPGMDTDDEEAAGDEQDGEEAEAEAVSEEVMAEGARLYRRHCASCHGEEGGGGAGPRLANNSEMENSVRVARQIIHGGGFMPPFGDQLNDEQVAAVGTFIRNSWGNSFGPLTPEQASEVRR